MIYLLDELIEEAKSRGVSLDDLFLPSEEICNPGQFLDELSENMTDKSSWISKARERVTCNRPGDLFYDVLMGYLDSLGTGQAYQKIQPAKYIIENKEKKPVDGRHRAVFCQKLNLPLPVEEL